MNQTLQNVLLAHSKLEKREQNVLFQREQNTAQRLTAVDVTWLEECDARIRAIKRAAPLGEKAIEFSFQFNYFNRDKIKKAFFY